MTPEQREQAAKALESAAAMAGALAGLIPGGAGAIVGTVVAGAGSAAAKLVRVAGDGASVLIDKLVAARGQGLITDEQLAADDAEVTAAIAAMYGGAQAAGGPPPNPFVGADQDVRLALAKHGYATDAPAKTVATIIEELRAAEARLARMHGAGPSEA